MALTHGNPSLDSLLIYAVHGRCDFRSAIRVGAPTGAAMRCREGRGPGPEPYPLFNEGGNTFIRDGTYGG